LQKDLDKTRKALDRQKMEFDKEKLEWADNVKIRERDTATPGAKANGSGAATPNGKIEEEVKPSIAGPSADVVLQDTSELENLAASRLADLEVLRQQHTSVQQELDRLRVERSSPSEETLRSSPWFQIYLHRLAFHQQRADEMEKRADQSEAKNDEIRQTNGNFREMLVTEARQELEALKQNMARKEEEAARLRGQRDDMQAQLSERKAKEAEKTQFIEQVEGLATSRQERINHLASEVKRLKAKLGAQSGSETYLGFLKGDGGIDGDYVKDLETRLE
jgi:E3 ubiquitin-protein ligase BRE1